jgi:hypothetical protein
MTGETEGSFDHFALHLKQTIFRVENLAEDHRIGVCFDGSLNVDEFLQ